MRDSKTLIRSFLAFLCLVTSIHLQANSEAGDSIRFYLGYFHQFQFAGYYAAVEQGYFEEEGLAVRLDEFDKTYGPKALLEQGYDYAIASGGQVLVDPRVEEILVVVPVFQHSPISLVALKDSGINLLKDMEGKKIGTGSEAKAMMLNTGMDLNSIEFVSHTTDINRLKNGELDAITRYITDIELARDINREEIVWFRPITYGINFYGEVLITSQKELKENPSRVAAMRRATIKGWQYAVDHPDEMIDLIVNKYHSKLTREELEKEAEIVIHTLVRPSLYDVGFSDINKWGHMQRTISNFRDYSPTFDLNQIIFNPEGQSNARTQRLLQYAMIVAAIGAVIVTILLLYNWQLSKGVKKRTAELNQANMAIKSNNERLAAQTEELESLNFFKVKMLSIISHDVKGPLNSIQGLVEMAERESHTMEDFKDILKHTGFKVQEMSSFMDNILIWAKGQLQGIKLEKQPVNLWEITAQVLKIFGFSISNKGLQLENNVEDMSISADPNAIRLVLRNLISNAIKFCNRGDTITLKTQKDKDQIVFFVSDTGLGMNEEAVKKAFSPDIKSSQGSDNELGTGLGLMLCKEFIELHQGRIGVDSQEGKGTTFWFSLPV